MKRTASPTAKSCARLIGLAIEMPPAFYIAITGNAPAWARIWLAAWLSLWLVANVIAAGTATAADR